MLSVENKLPAFNNFCSGDLDFEQVTLAKIQVTTTDNYSKPRIEILNFLLP